MRLLASYTWKGETRRPGLPRQRSIKLAWCVLLFNWPWNINRFGIQWLTFDCGETERPASDVCDWICCCVSRHGVGALASLLSRVCSVLVCVYSDCSRHRRIEWLAHCNCANDELCPPCGHRDWCCQSLWPTLALRCAETLEPRVVWGRLCSSWTFNRLLVVFSV